MLVLGIVFFIAGFALLAFFPSFMSSSPNKVAGWLYALLTATPFGLGLFSIIKVKAKEAIIAMILVYGWSVILLIPVPNGYEEPIYGGFLVFLVAIMMLYNKSRGSKKKENQNLANPPEK
jgi:small neutral amino acid transporter SnatA (MarC family)